VKIAIVTGASSGLGREFVRQLEYCYTSLDEIWVIARRRERLEVLQEEVKIPLRIIEGDLLQHGVFVKLKRLLDMEKPNVRMLVNAAGFGRAGAFADIAGHEENAQFDMINLNCTALTRVVQYCLPYLSKGSRIVNLASAAAFCPQPGFVVYAATKAYVLSFSRGLGVELKQNGIYVTAVCPGPVDTEFFEGIRKMSSSMKQVAMVKPQQVVRQALLDARAKKPVSVYSLLMKSVAVAAKVVPHELVIKALANESGVGLNHHQESGEL